MSPERSLIPPPPELRVRPGIYINGDDRLELGRYCVVDGDYTNAIVTLGVRLRTEDKILVDVGLDMTVPPSLFWLLDLFKIK